MKGSSSRLWRARGLWQKLAVLVILGVAVHLILPQITSLENSWRVVTQLRLWAVGLALAAQVASYLGSGYLLQQTLAIARQRVSFGRSTLIVLGAASVSMVAGGTLGSSAAIYRWTRTEESSIEGATLAGLLPPLFNNLLLTLVSVFGLARLIAAHNLSRAQFIGFGAALGFLLVILGLILLAARFRERAAAGAARVSTFLARVRKKTPDPAKARNELTRVFSAWDALWRGRWPTLALGALLNIGFDMLTMDFLFIAAGDAAPLGVLLAGYGLPQLLGKIAFILPGGVGVVESSMAALFSQLGVAPGSAVVVILGYRLISFWIPSLLGFPIAAYLQSGRKDHDPGKRALEPAK